MVSSISILSSLTSRPTHNYRGDVVKFDSVHPPLMHTVVINLSVRICDSNFVRSDPLYDQTDFAIKSSHSVHVYAHVSTSTNINI